MFLANLSSAEPGTQGVRFREVKVLQHFSQNSQAGQKHKFQIHSFLLVL